MVRDSPDSDLMHSRNVGAAVKYRLPIKIVIIKNNALGMIKWEQMVFLGNPLRGRQGG